MVSNCEPSPSAYFILNKSIIAILSDGDITGIRIIPIHRRNDIYHHMLIRLCDSIDHSAIAGRDVTTGIGVTEALR